MGGYFLTDACVTKGESIVTGYLPIEKQPQRFTAGLLRLAIR